MIKKDNFPFDSPTFFVGENFRKLTWNNGLMINLNALMLKIMINRNQPLTFFSESCKILRISLKHLKQLTLNYLVMNLRLTLFCITIFKRQTYKMVKHTKTILRLLRTNCLSVFDHFVGWALKGLVPSLALFHGLLVVCFHRNFAVVQFWVVFFIILKLFLSGL